MIINDVGNRLRIGGRTWSTAVNVVRHASKLVSDTIRDVSSEKKKIYNLLFIKENDKNRWRGLQAS